MGSNEFFVQCLLLHSVVKMSKAKGKKPQRSGSNVFANFDQQQIQEFKEAFTIIDQDRDGFISEKDLKDMWASLGIVQDDKFCSEMTKVSPGQINFTSFLTFMGEKLADTDPEEISKRRHKPKNGLDLEYNEISLMGPRTDHPTSRSL